MKTDNPSKKSILNDLHKIDRFIETLLGIELMAEDFAAGKEEIEHIYCHEACHAALAHCVPWVAELPEQEHTAVDEIMARLIEKEVAPELGLFTHSDKEFLEELAMYPVDLDWEAYNELLSVWQAQFWPARDLPGMARYVQTVLRYGDVVYHILPRSDWEAAQSTGIYQPVSLVKEGFIHCSRIDQVLRVANAFYQDQDDLLLLCIATNQLVAEVKYEDMLGEGIGFPHIYGPLNLDAVTVTFELRKDPEESFTLPG
jgi:uncharacterized protein (DUF952 family)